MSLFGAFAASTSPCARAARQQPRVPPARQQRHPCPPPPPPCLPARARARRSKAESSGWQSKAKTAYPVLMDLCGVDKHTNYFPGGGGGGGGSEKGQLPWLSKAEGGAPRARVGGRELHTRSACCCR